MFDEILTEQPENLERALDILELHGVDFRAARHAAMLLDRRLSRIASSDPAFDRIPGLERIG